MEGGGEHDDLLRRRAAWGGDARRAVLAVMCRRGAGWNGGGPFADEPTSGNYDCVVTLLPGADLPAGQAVSLLLETGSGASDLRVEVNKTAIRIIARTKGQRRLIGTAASRVVPGQVYPLTIMRCGAALVLCHEHALLFRGTAPRGAGTVASLSAAAGWQVVDARIGVSPRWRSPMTSCALPLTRRWRAARGRK